MLFAMAGRPVGTIPFALHRHHIRWTLDHLRRDLPATNDPPTLVFAHLLIPHPPFSFEPDGSPLESRLPANFNDGSHWQAQAEGRGETYRSRLHEGYPIREQRCPRHCSKRCKSSGRPADHLLYPGRPWTGFQARLGGCQQNRRPGTPRNSDGRQVPNPSPESKLPAWITPVNSFRRMLNEALGSSSSAPRGPLVLFPME